MPEPAPAASRSEPPEPSKPNPANAAETAAATPSQIAAETLAPASEEVETMENTVNETISKSQNMFADMSARAKGAMEKNMKMAEEMNDFAKGNVEAMVESGKITAKGLESIGQDAAEYGRSSFEHMTATMKNIAQIKSPTELFKLQSDFVRGAFDSYVAQASKQTEAMLKLAGDAAQPLSSRFAVAADKAKSVA